MNFNGWKLVYPLILAVFLIEGVFGPARAQTVVEGEPAQVYSEVTSVSLERPFWLAFRIFPKPGFYVPYIDPETGNKALVVEIALPDGFLKGETLESVPVFLTEGAGYGFDKAFWVLQEIIPGHDAKFQEEYTFPGQVSWAECQGETCRDHEKELSLSLPYGPGQASVKTGEIMALARASLPKQMPWPVRYSGGGGHFRLEIFGGPDDVKLANGIILTSQGRTPGDINEAIEVRMTPDSVILEGRPAGYLPRSSLEGLFLVPGMAEGAFILNVKNEFETERGSSYSRPGLTGITIWLALGFAFLGGLILNLMPCVFPVLTLKVFALVKSGTHSHKALRLDGLAYTAGILMTFAFVALLLLTFREMGHQVGWGFQLQSPYFVTFLGLLMFAVALNFAGVFEINLPFAISADPRHHGTLGSFYTGMLATVVATPCTAPFMAPALGFALTLSTGEALLVFLMLGLGLALPYLLVSFVPAIQKIFPKPGRWMVILKKILAIPLFLTVIWLAWVLSTQVGAGGVWVFLLYAALLTALLLGLKKRKAVSKGLAFTGFLIFAGVSGGLVYETLPVLKNTARTVHPEGSDTVAWSDDAVWNLRLQGKGVFVNYTANWCLTCKVNEELVFKKEKFQRYLSEHNIVYMEADWTSYDPAISKSLEGLGRNALPVYVFYPQGGPTKDPVLLPEVLTLEKALEIIAANGS